MPAKKLLDIPNDFVEKILAIIANESEKGRKAIIHISKAAEEKYEKPVRSWLTGWVYQHTRVRGDEIKQSIQVMEDFPDAYTRLQTFKELVSEGEWKVGSYNYFLFLELIDAIPNYEPLEERLKQDFVLLLKEEVIKQIDNFIAQHKVAVEEKKLRELEFQKIQKSEHNSIENFLIFNDIELAKEALVQQQNKVIFCLNVANHQWHLHWIDKTGKIYPLNLSEELTQKLSILKEQEIQKLSPVHLKRIKQECIKVRAQFLSKIQVLINPEDSQTHNPLTNEELIKKGVTSTFILRHTGKEEPSLYWINSIGVSNKIDLENYLQLDAWLATHKNLVNEEDILQFKIYLLQVKTTQSISSAKLNNLNNLLSKTRYKQEQEEQAQAHPVREANKLDIGQFQHLSKLMQDRAAAMASSPKPAAIEEKSVSKRLGPDRYTALSQLPTFWQKHKVVEEAPVVVNQTMFQNN